MGVKKIKISALPLADTLVGLYTIGVNALNKSVKVSLEFLKTAADKANDAATAANKAKTAAETATEAAKTATKNANTATEAANTAAKNATDKATAADTAAKMRTQKPMQRTKLPGQQRQQRTPPIPKPPSQTKRPQPPGQRRKSRRGDRRGSTSHNRKVGGIGRIARRAVQNDSDRHEPRLSASHNIPKHVPRRITYELLPTNTGRNVLFLGDDNAVSVNRRKPHSQSDRYSKIHVIPTENTSIYRTIQITVAEPELRRVKSNSLRLMGNGSFRLT